MKNNFEHMRDMEYKLVDLRDKKRILEEKIEKANEQWVKYRSAWLREEK